MSRTNPVFLSGHRVLLGPVDNMVSLLKWANDPEITRFWTTGPVGTWPLTYGQVQEWLWGVGRGNKGVAFLISDRAKQQAVGVILLRDIDWVNRIAQLEIAIGEKAFWGKGLALEAVRLVVNHAFNTLGLQKVWLGLYEGNSRAHELYQKVGFFEEARLKRELWREGKWWDRIVMAIWKEVP